MKKYYKDDIVEQMRVPNKFVVKGQRYRVVGPCNWNQEKKNRYSKEEVASMLELEDWPESFHDHRHNYFLHYRPLKNYIKALFDWK